MVCANASKVNDKTKELVQMTSSCEANIRYVERESYMLGENFSATALDNKEYLHKVTNITRKIATLAIMFAAQLSGANQWMNNEVH